MKTRLVKISSPLESLGHFSRAPDTKTHSLEHWELEQAATTDTEHFTSLSALQEAASYLKTKDTPIAFPTETVYGLGADATRSGSVKGIYHAKGRPSDNPLIVHVCDLHMLRGLLSPGHNNQAGDPELPQHAIPQRYHALIDKFWPGPLTILLPNPQPSPLAPEVTAGLSSFGVRMPSSPLALSLIKLAGVPLAAPSANASTKPSPTTAQHVMDDLDGRIELILDGGACHVGVESTVVDGLCDPPVVLRPGGVGMDELRSCPGWENVVKAYKDASEEGSAAPRAPGMKYKHYSPRAMVILYESSCETASAGIEQMDLEISRMGISQRTSQPPTTGTVSAGHRLGVIRTRRWREGAGLSCGAFKSEGPHGGDVGTTNGDSGTPYNVVVADLLNESKNAVGEVMDIDLGKETRGIAQGIFSALRQLDQRGADVIFVDGIDDDVDIAAAVMNRLRKAASVIRT